VSRPAHVSRVRAVLAHPLTLWIAFVLVHLALGGIALSRVPAGVGDVVTTYPVWIEDGLQSGQWVGIQLPWVYPILALPPMLLADVFGPAWIAPMWLSLVLVADAAAFAVLTGFARERRTALAAWWWLAFLLALGPIALTRIDSFATPAALAGVLLLARAPRVAGALLAVGAWIKVWPAALLAAAVVALRRRLDVLLGAVVLSAAVVAVGLALGAGANLFSFISAQSGRGLQIEAPLATPFLWGAAAHGPFAVYYDTEILTYQVRGPGVLQVADLGTPLLVVAVGAVLVLGVIAARRGASAAALLPPLVLGFTAALFVANKVGSPQYAGWLAVPIVLGLALRATAGGRRFAGPAILTLVVAGLTQIIYPFLYDLLLELQPGMLIVLTVRNLLLIVLFAWAIVLLVDRVRRPWSEEDDGAEAWLPNAWPFRRRGLESRG
jgi:hypothetical protein